MVFFPLVILLGISLAYNFKQYFDRKNAKRVVTLDAKQLLHDLTHGGAIVKVTVIDPSGIMIYRGIE